MKLNNIANDFNNKLSGLEKNLNGNYKPLSNEIVKQASKKIKISVL